MPWGSVAPSETRGRFSVSGSVTPASSQPGFLHAGQRVASQGQMIFSGTCCLPDPPGKASGFVSAREHLKPEKSGGGGSLGAKLCRRAQIPGFPARGPSRTRKPRAGAAGRERPPARAHCGLWLPFRGTWVGAGGAALQTAGSMPKSEKTQSGPQGHTTLRELVTLLEFQENEVLNPHGRPLRGELRSLSSHRRGLRPVEGEDVRSKVSVMF